MYLADDATEEELREMAEVEREQRNSDMKVISGLLHTNPWDARNGD